MELQTEQLKVYSEIYHCPGNHI